jgi:hypothetical protein
MIVRSLTAPIATKSTKFAVVSHWAWTVGVLANHAAIASVPAALSTAELRVMFKVITPESY